MTCLDRKGTKVVGARTVVALLLMAASAAGASCWDSGWTDWDSDW